MGLQESFIASTPRRPTPNPSRPVARTPVSQRELTRAEKIILLQSAKLNPHIFPEWDEKCLPKESEFTGEPFSYVPSITKSFEYLETNVYCRDTAGPLPLSIQQTRNFERWYRPHEIWNGKENMVLEQEAEDLPADLSQDIISDCSVVASLCAAFMRERKGHGSVWFWSSKIWKCGLRS